MQFTKMKTTATLAYLIAVAAVVALPLRIEITGSILALIGLALLVGHDSTPRTALPLFRQQRRRLQPRFFPPALSSSRGLNA